MTDIYAILERNDKIYAEMEELLADMQKSTEEQLKDIESLERKNNTFYATIGGLLV